MSSKDTSTHKTFDAEQRLEKIRVILTTLDSDLKELKARQAKAQRHE